MYSKFFCPLVNISLQLDSLFQPIHHSSLRVSWLKSPLQQQYESKDMHLYIYVYKCKRRKLWFYSFIYQNEFIKWIHNIISTNVILFNQQRNAFWKTFCTLLKFSVQLDPTVQANDRRVKLNLQRNNSKNQKKKEYLVFTIIFLL